MNHNQSQQESRSSNKSWIGATLATAGLLAWGYSENKQILAKEREPMKPEEFPYILIGCGPAVLSAAATIREKDPEQQILIIGEYESVPHTRRALTSVLLGKEPQVDIIDKQPAEWFEDNKITYLPNTAVWALNSSAKIIRTEGNRVFSYDKCLIATGSKPEIPTFDIEDGAPVSTFHTMEEAIELRELLQEGDKSVAIIGGSSWSCTVASVLNSKYKGNNIKVTHLIPGTGICEEILPPYLGEHALKKHSARKNITALSNSVVTSITNGEEGGAHISLANGNSVDVDHVVIVPDMVPNTRFAEGLEIDEKGIVGNRELQVVTDLYVAGESASHYDPGYGRRTLLGENNEILSGRAAAANMTGDRNLPYATDIVEEFRVAGNKFFCIGRCDPSLRTHSVWLRPAESWDDEDYSSNDYRRGIVYFLSPDNRIVGTILWNMPDQNSQKEDRAISVIKNRRVFREDSAATAIVISETDIE